MIPEGIIRGLHQPRLTLVALATINLLRPLSLIPPPPPFPGKKVIKPGRLSRPLNGKL